MKKRLFRMIFVIAGVLTVAVILLSQSISFPSDKDAAQTKANHKTEQSREAFVIQAPADVVISPSVHLDEPTPSMLKPAVGYEKVIKPFFTFARILTPYFNTLFRAIISPNAP